MIKTTMTPTAANALIYATNIQPQTLIARFPSKLPDIIHYKYTHIYFILWLRLKNWQWWPVKKNPVRQKIWSRFFLCQHFSGVRVSQSFVVYVVFVRTLFVLLAVVLYILRLMVSDYPLLKSSNFMFVQLNLSDIFCNENVYIWISARESFLE